ncbi:MAG: Wzz/FepE/Etk N-terminal domain-containing protein [Ignavibacteriales bacterium]|nr:Wzz/FepE/Etk N-terminal domain-containing protein [Ignavibacteriales bacterium]
MKSKQTEPLGDQTNRPVTNQPETDGPRPLGTALLDFFAVITKWRKLITRTVFIITVIAVAVGLLSPKWYKATASVFPAEKADMFAGLEGISSLVKSISPGRALSGLAGSSEMDRYRAILTSESALLKVIERFDLTKVYEITNYPREKTIKELLSNVGFEVAEEGNLQIIVYDTDPQRAADMANYFVHVLNETNSQLQVQNARSNRLFVETRYHKNLADLKGAEDSLKAFQQKYGVIALPEQLEASIKAMAEIYGKMEVQDVGLTVLRQTVAKDHPSIRAAEIELDAMRNKIRQLNNGTAGAPGDVSVLVPFKQAPRLGTAYVRLYREVEIQYKILQFVTPLYEQAKVEEQRATPSVIVLDSAQVPERKAKPKVSLYGFLAMVISTIVVLGIVFAIEGVQKLEALDPDRFKSLWSTMRTDWFGLRWTRKAKR